MSYLKPCTGFEVPLTILNGMGITSTAGSIAVDTGTLHQNSSGHGGAQSLKINSSSTASIVVTGVSGRTHIYLALYVTSLASVTTINFVKSSTTNCAFKIETSGLIGLYRSSLLTTSIQGITVNTWHILQWDITVADSGQCKLYLDMGATPIIDVSSTDIQNSLNADFDQITIASPNAMYIDDLIINDNSTGKQTKEWYAAIVRPNGAGGTTNLTPTGSGTNYLNVDEASVDTADYNSATAVGQLDRYQHGDLPYTPNSILMIQPIAWCSRDGTITQARTTIKSNATTADGSYASIAGSGVYAPISDLFLVDPDTGSAWTPTAVNAVEAGVQFN